MTITIITPPECTDFTTLQAVKDYFDITDNDSDTKIERGIKYVSDFIRRVTGRTFAEQTILETVRGFGNTQLMLSLYPITNIESISLRGELITDYEESDPAVGILYRRRGWQWSVQSLSGVGLNPIPNSEDYIYAVTYTGGYCMPCAESCERTLPYDIEQAAIELIGMYMDSTPLNIAQIKVGDYSTTYRAGVPETITSILKNYTAISTGI